MIYSFFVDKEARIFLGISLVFMSLLMLPMLFRNYVLIEQNRIQVVFGFLKDSMEISEIREINEEKSGYLDSLKSVKQPK